MNRFWPLHSMKVSMNYLLVYRGFDDPREYVLSFQLYCFPSALKMVQDIERELNQSALRPSINILQQNGDSPWPSHRVIYFSFVQLKWPVQAEHGCDRWGFPFCCAQTSSLRRGRVERSPFPPRRNQHHHMRRTTDVTVVL